MAKIVGKTFDHRETLKALGAKWDGNGKFWLIDDANEAGLSAIRNLSGVFITEPGNNPPKADPFPSRRRPAPAMPADEAATPAPSSEPRDPVSSDTIGLVDKSALKNRLFLSYGSLGEMVSDVERGAKRGGSDGFAGGSMEKAIDLARNGWSRGSYLAGKAVELITSEHVETRQRAHGVAGGRVNVGRMLSGNPMHMTTRTRQPGEKVITLYVDSAMSASVDAETFTIRAACVAAIVDILENNGFSAEIVSVMSAHCREQSKGGWQILTRVKTAGEPLNLDDVSYSLGHPTMLRQLGFALVRDYPVVSDMHGYMGQPVYSDHVTLENGEYRIPLFNDNPSGTFEEKVREIFEAILPEGLPVTLK